MKQYVLKLILPIVALLMLTGCDEDSWRDRQTIVGSWQVVETTKVSGACPYRRGDVFDFCSDGAFYAEGYDLYEEGLWDTGHNYIYIDFDFDGYDDVRARIRELSPNYMAIDVQDAYYGSRYTLRLVRY